MAFDSADAWGHPELFQFDEKGISGGSSRCPPDAFSATGQLWVIPFTVGTIIKRLALSEDEAPGYSFNLYDTVRVDHFRGFDEYYRVPAGREDAIVGTWEKGPGIQLFNQLKERFGDLDIIAEDLGF